MKDFTNNIIAIDQLPKFEEVPFQPIHKDYLTIMYIRNAFFFIVLAAGLLVFMFINETAKNNGLIFLLGYILFLTVRLLLTRISFKKRGYALRQRDVLYRKGVLATQTTIIPFNRIQHVALHEGFLLRLFQLASLQIYTAGGSSSDLTISGIPRETAESIKEFLMGKVNEEPESPENFREDNENKNPENLTDGEF